MTPDDIASTIYRAMLWHQAAPWIRWIAIAICLGVPGAILLRRLHYHWRVHRRVVRLMND
jgi:hypothetical protein